MKKHINKLFLLISFLFIAFGSFAQSSCDDKIIEAEELYEEGKYNKVVNILTSVLEECEISKNKRSEIDKYLSGAYYEMDEIEEADKYMMRFIKKNSYYEINESNDPYAFKQEIVNFKTWSLFYISLSGGTSIDNILVEKIYPVKDSTSTNYNQPVKTTKSFSVLAEVGWNINKYLSINSGFGASSFTLNQSIPMYSGLNFDYKENIIQLNVPIYLKFSYPFKNGLIPAIYLGADFTQLYSINYAYSYSQTGTINPDNEFLISRKKDNIPITYLANQRNLNRNSALAGARLSYRLKKIQIYLDFRYKMDIESYNKIDERYFDADLFLSNSYVLPDFKIESYQVLLGFSFDFMYKVKSKY